MDVNIKNKYCGYIMFNTSSSSGKGPGSRSGDLLINNYDALTNCDSDLYPQTGTTNNSMAAGAAAVDEQNVKKDDDPFQIYDPSSNNNDNGKKLPGSSKMQVDKRPPRPPNAFILYRRAKQPAILAEHRNLTNAEISRYISNCWKNEPEEERLAWERYADQKKLEHMQAYPNYVYRPNKNKGKNEKRRQARKSAVATFTSQDNNCESGGIGPIRTKKIKGQNRSPNLVGRIEIPMNKVTGIQNIQNVPIMTPPLSSPNTPTSLPSNNNNNNNNDNNLIYTTMPMHFAEPEEIVFAAQLQQQMRMQDFLLQQNNGLTGLTFSDLSPGSFHEETVDPSIFSFPTGEDFYSSHHNSSFDTTTSTSSPDLHVQKINPNNYPEFRENNLNSQGLADMFTGIHHNFEPFQYQNCL